MRVSEKDVMELLSILDGTITDPDLDEVNIGGFTFDQRRSLWMKIRNQQSNELVDLEHGGKPTPL